MIEKETLLQRANMTNFIYVNEFLYLGIIFLYYAYGLHIIGLKQLDCLSFLTPILIIWVVFFIKEIIRDKSTELGVTSFRVIGKKGFIRIKTLDTHIENVDNVQVSYSFWGRIFRYGTITIESKSDSYNYRAIANPLRIKQAINEQIIRIKNKEEVINE